MNRECHARNVLSCITSDVVTVPMHATSEVNISIELRYINESTKPEGELAKDTKLGGPQVKVKRNEMNAKECTCPIGYPPTAIHLEFVSAGFGGRADRFAGVQSTNKIRYQRTENGREKRAK